MTPDTTNSIPPDFTVTRDPHATASDPNATGSVGSAPTSPLPVDVTLEELGRGAMGVVYKATQPGLNRTVAVKMLLGEAADPRMALRFLAEAEAVAAIDHPHVVRVYEFGRRDGKPFLAMEYLPGGTLADQLTSGGRKSPVESATLVHKLALGVAAAHTAGIVHRDLKPGNVLFDAAGEPKVTDFGLAKRSTGADLTRTQAWMGTPAYMSPEQAKGEGKFVGPPADVWSLGVILYECLTGKRPFTGDDTWALLQAVMSAEPASLRSLSGDVPRDVELIVAKCLRKDPAERYATAGELAEDLRRYLAGEPILARPVPGAVRAWMWARRNRSLTAAIVSLTVGAGAASWQAVRANAEAKRADDRAQDAEKATKREQARAEGEEWERKRADAEKDAAKASDLNTRRLIGRMAVAEGIRVADAGKSFEALAWFAQPRQRVPEDSADDLVAERVAAYRTFGRLPALISLSQTDFDTLNRRRVGGLDIRLVNSFEKKEYTARVWDTATGQPVTPPLAHAGRVWSASFSPDGRRVATASFDKTARVWDVATGLPITPPLGHASSVVWASFSPDCRRVATASWDRTARVWDAATGVPITPPLPHASFVRSASFSPDGRRVATTSEDGTHRVWDMATGTPVTSPVRREGSVVWAAFSPDGRRVVTASNDHTARVWDTATGQPLTPSLPHEDSVVWAAFSPDGQRVATASFDKTARVWDAVTGVPITPPLPHAGQVTSVSFSPDGRRVVTTSNDRTARVWDTATGQPVTPPLKHEGSVVWASFSPDGRQVVTASNDKTARVWDAATGQPVGPPLPHASFVLLAAFSPDGQRVVTTCRDRTTRVWDAATGQPATLPLKHEGWIISVSFSLDGRRVVTASQDRTARVWDMATGTPVTPSLKHESRLRSAVFSPDGRRVATASDDGTARVWDSSTGIPVTPPLTHGSAVVSVVFGPEGRSVITVCQDNATRIWDLPTDDRPSEDLIKLAHLYAGGTIDDSGGFAPLTTEETKKLFTELQAKYPADFTVTPAQAMAWHHEQLEEAERDQDWFAVAFHLRLLLKQYAFADVELMMKLGDAEAKLKPREVLPPPVSPR